MPKDDIRSEYSRWMYGLVCNDRYTDTSFNKLFSYLDSVEFIYTVPMDGNRYEDGIELRYRFGREQGFDEREIAEVLDCRPCSVLEMMIALAIRCEEHIMDDDRFGDRTGQWFWEMMLNLGLVGMSDKTFDEKVASKRVDIFLNRRYMRNGNGGALFRINNPNRDMRTAEIWYQMCWYLSEYLEGDSNA